MATSELIIKSGITLEKRAEIGYKDSPSTSQFESGRGETREIIVEEAENFRPIHPFSST